MSGLAASRQYCSANCKSPTLKTKMLNAWRCRPSLPNTSARSSNSPSSGSLASARSGE
ncbi:hypothetical protein FBU59_006132 [Linderina macrospora]|uniref:Uncharacterized protein n=1 Tax=Linderina macrospora TaxID=4868 RepID=A0ACC1J0U8_9FUNG|nr:hypothetical protein FBU59_006132 [Linderina macrospora]